MADSQFNPLGSVTAPADWTLPASLNLLLKNVYASFDGTGAGGSFVPCLQIVSDSGHTVGTYPCATTVAAGASADVTWFPRVKQPCPDVPPAPPLGQLWAWYDFSDSSTVTISGGRISALADKSGLGHNLSGAAGHRPTTATVNGLTAGYFDSFAVANAALVNLSISDPLAQPFTIAGVFTQDHANFANWWPGAWGGSLNDGTANCFWNDSGAGPWLNSGVGSIQGTQVNLPCTQIQVTEIADGASSSIRVNGTATAGNLGSPSYPVASVSLGAQHYPNNPVTPAQNNYLDGKVCEVLYYFGHLTSAQIAGVESYLKTKWGT